MAKISYNFNSRSQQLTQSRLTRKQRLQNWKTVIFMSLLTAGVLGGVMYWGVPLFINVISLWADWQTTPAQATQNHPPPPAPRIIVTTKYTKESALEVKGFAQSGALVTMYVNDQNTRQLTAESTGQFVASNIPLTPGTNIIYATATDAYANTSSPSAKEQVTYDNIAPKLTIESPQSGAQFRTSKNQTIEIKGSVEEGSRVWINDRLVILGADGRFASSFRLIDGDQEVTVKAVDQAGNETIETLSLAYIP